MPGIIELWAKPTKVSDNGYAARDDEDCGNGYGDGCTHEGNQGDSVYGSGNGAWDGDRYGHGYGNGAGYGNGEVN